MAHHENRARLALDETLQLHYAVENVIELASLTDTLVIVTSDHSHTMSIGGYPVNKIHIFGSKIRLPTDLICKIFLCFFLCFSDVETIF